MWGLSLYQYVDPRSCGDCPSTNMSTQGHVGTVPLPICRPKVMWGLSFYQYVDPRSCGDCPSTNMSTQGHVGTVLICVMIVWWGRCMTLSGEVDAWPCLVRSMHDPVWWGRCMTLPGQVDAWPCLVRSMHDPVWSGRCMTLPGQVDAWPCLVRSMHDPAWSGWGLRAVPTTLRGNVAVAVFSSGPQALQRKYIYKVPFSRKLAKWESSFVHFLCEANTFLVRI